MIDPRYNRTFADKLNEWTGQPVFWAAIASLGLHGILFAALPSFSSGTANLEERTVSVVELGAEDLQRLPNFPELANPSLPDVDDPYDFDLDPLENWDDVLKDLGIEPDPDPVIPKSPGLLAPTPRSPLLPPPTSTPSPLPGPVRSWTQPQPRRIIIPTPTPTPGLTPTPTPSPPTPQGLQAANPNEIDIELEGFSLDNETNPGGEGNPASTEGEQTPETPDPTPQQIDEAVMARLLAENQQRQKVLAYLNGVQEAGALFTVWSRHPTEENVSLDVNQNLPLEACAAGRDVTAELGVLVGRNNKPIDRPNIPNPVFIKLSAHDFWDEDGPGEDISFDPEAYEFLDQRALELSLSYAYENEEQAGKKRRSFMTVNFEYDESACSAYLAEQEAKEEEQADSSDASEESAGTGATTAPPAQGVEPQPITVNAPLSEPEGQPSSESNPSTPSNQPAPPDPQPVEEQGQPSGPSSENQDIPADGTASDLSDSQPSGDDG